MTRYSPRLAEPPSPTGTPKLPVAWTLPLFLAGCAALACEKAGLFVPESLGAKVTVAIVEFLGLLGLLSAGMRARNVVALVLGLGLAFSAPALAQERLVFGTNPTLAGDVPRLTDYLSLSAAAGAAWRPGAPVQPLVTALGLVHLARLGPSGPLLSAALGGQAVLPDGAPAELGFFGGLGLDLPGAEGQSVKPLLVLGTAYQSDGWRLAVVLGLRLFPGG